MKIFQMQNLGASFKKPMSCKHAAALCVSDQPLNVFKLIVAYV